MTKRRVLFLHCCLLLAITAMGDVIKVKNIVELNEANRKAQPGDFIILQNGNWNDITIRLTCMGTAEKPITFKAATAGKVIIGGNSRVWLGGEYITMDGFYFTNGYAGKDAVINFRADKNKVANNCRVTNCVIDGFNNPGRLDENYWVALYGKKNRVDHCSFLNKKNVGVLLAVVLDDERSRENVHSIDHNYFGLRVPLASNGGEIIRVGVSQHCQFNSNTQIRNNFFEHCDGETEVVSIKSGSNSVAQNVFKECQGSVVLRHGDDNIVTGNYFLGNDKPGSGGVRVINKGQTVTGNVFYKCRGSDFRSPLAVMNGIPNSPANRYVQVTDAEISGNIFYECNPVSFCEGSDAERTLPPDKVVFSRNTFYNTSDSVIYKVYDDMNGFRFTGNRVSMNVRQVLLPGFEKTNLPRQKLYIKGNSGKEGYPGTIYKAEQQAYLSSGAAWFPKNIFPKPVKPLVVTCFTAEDIYKQLARKEPVNIRLTGIEYSVNRPFVITKTVRFAAEKNTPIKFISSTMQSVFVLSGNGNLELNNLAINGEHVNASHFISSDSSGKSDHFSLSVSNCTIEGLSRFSGCSAIFYSYKSMVADSIIFRNNNFFNNNCNGIVMTEEKDNKGYYNAEKIVVSQNNISSQNGSLLAIYRGGNDESTMGPYLIFTNNKVTNCNENDRNALIYLSGVQRTVIEGNSFTSCNTGGELIVYEDVVRALHLLRNNLFSASGKITTNKYVLSENNAVH